MRVMDSNYNGVPDMSESIVIGPLGDWLWPGVSRSRSQKEPRVSRRMPFVLKTVKVQNAGHMSIDIEYHKGIVQSLEHQFEQ